jgi:hypothetical protein
MENSKKVNNPPAFALYCHQTESHDEFIQKGMTLLDYFAAKAIPSLIEIHYANGNMISKDASFISERAYQVAASMLKEREKHI